MPQFETHRSNPHSADQMFDLVADVDKYPQFLPLCEALVVRSRRDRDGKVLLVADMTVGYKSIRETFSTHVLLNRPEHVIDVRYIDGPFKRLENRWRFEDTPSGSNAHFFIDYEFKNRILGALMGTMFDRAFRTFSEAFELRAARIYG